MEPIILAIGLGLVVLLQLLILLRLGSRRDAGDLLQLREQLDRLGAQLDQQSRTLGEELNRISLESTLKLGERMSQQVREEMRTQGDSQRLLLGEMKTNLSSRLEQSQQTVTQQFQLQEARLATFATDTRISLEGMRLTMEQKLAHIQEDNNKKLDQMREIVDQKLQKTINDRMNESFKLVGERLEQVYKGLGEMQSLAQGVGDLKKVLSNVKTRGVLGEIQLGAILEEILTPGQYDKNVCTKQGSRAFVEYAVKLPTEDGQPIYLPVDSKFHGEVYGNLVEAYQSGSQEQVEVQVRALKTAIRVSAKEIRDKYVDPPHTTEFAILFLPFEGLYAEVVNRGLVEELQRDYRINVAGPSTMAALLNSLQMAFKTYAIQKRSGEVWNVLGAVKTEFEKFEEALRMTQQRLGQANDELDKLVGVRTRQIRRRLKDVTSLEEGQAEQYLTLGEDSLSPEG